ncbi:MAG: DUF488 domain-containing protein [Gammaproteobacteria bacterium]
MTGTDSEAMRMPVAIKRIYEQASPADGYRVLVDRLWPRGVSRDEAALDAWMKELAPTDELRKWFHSEPSRWGEFRRRYLVELKGHRETVRALAQRARSGSVTLLFAASDRRHNNAVVLKQYLKMLGVD